MTGRYILAVLLAAMLTSFTNIRDRLLGTPVQEKVYLHIDNTCYFKGDTIWYKAYVVRADSLTYTDMSRILYVELVSPDGMLVERQQIIVSGQGYSDGNFALRDSIYSGFYELRAYTRWMLNFRVTEHDYGQKDREYFYNAQMAEDFFRQFGTVYSRVVPVYERPEEPGDYVMKYIVNRPKTRLEKELKENLIVNFYPEGGHLIANTRCNVAFEALNEEGEQVDIEGSIGSQLIKTEHQGRGAFTVDVPESGRLTADFRYKDKDYHINLPKTDQTGCALRVEQTEQDITAHMTFVSNLSGKRYGAAVLCRGVLKVMEELEPDDKGQAVMKIDSKQLPTGVCNLVVFNETGQPLADRLFFVDHHDYRQQTITVATTTGDTRLAAKTYEPFEQIQLQFKAPADARHISIAVRDRASDEPTYDTGDMVTDLLLSSELQGFIAYPHYYFEADDATHRRHLDLLMMVQGWRRYDFKEMTSDRPLRYRPETAITVEGGVYPVPDSDEFQPDEVRYWAMGVFGYSPSTLGEIDAPQYLINELNERTSNVKTPSDEESGESAASSAGPVSTLYKENGVFNIKGLSNSVDIYQPRGGLRHEVTVKGELVFEDDIATIEMQTANGGHFAFSVPPYYGRAILFLKAQDTDISEKKQKKINNRGVLDETQWPEYYVKRDLFFPVFAKKYSYYQCHVPDDFPDDSADGSLPSLSSQQEEALSSFDRELKGVTVKKKRRRGRHAIDYSKPACVYDAQELYNLATDRGLSFGRYDAKNFPMQMSMALLGNYNSYRPMQVMARLNDQELTPYIYYRNYDPGPAAMEQFRTDWWITTNIKLNRQDIIRLYTDFELRNEDKHTEQTSQAADVTLDFMLMPDDSKRYTYRDRRLILDGMTEPADFYHPDYRQRPLPGTVKDYRRTLYWNPNAQLDEEGCFTATFYNNGKQTRIKVDATGLTSDGKPLTIEH